MHDVVVPGSLVPSMSDATIGKVREIERITAQMPQTPIATAHLFHAGLYARTVMVPPDTVMTGALIRRATVLIVEGETLMVTEEGTVALHGYNVLPMSARRKAALVAITETHLTMLFATNARTTAEAEDEFTNEPELLVSRRPDAENIVTVTGE